MKYKLEIMRIEKFKIIHHETSIYPSKKLATDYLLRFINLNFGVGEFLNCENYRIKECDTIQIGHYYNFETISYNLMKNNKKGKDLREVTLDYYRVNL